MLKGLRGVPDHPSVSLTARGEYRRGAVQSSFSSTRMSEGSDSGLIIANEVLLKRHARRELLGTDYSY